MSTSATAIVRGWMRELDVAIEKDVAGHAADGIPSRCGECTNPACCNQKIFVELFEGLHVAARLERDGRFTPEFRERLQAAADAMTGTRDEYFRRNIPCVFLEDGRCSVYEARPVACRGYFVTTPPENCAGDSGKVAALSTIHKTIKEAWKFGEKFAQELQLRPTPMRAYFHTLPEMVLRLMDARAGSQIEWRQHLRQQKWPTNAGIVAFMEGKPL